jgi:hypothetical protein
MQPQKHLIVLSLAIALVAGCRSAPPPAAPIPVPEPNNTLEGKVVGDERTAMEAAVDTGTTAPAPVSSETATGSGPVLAPNAPDSYVVKRGDTLWGIAKMFLRDPWYWPEIWQVNPQVQNPHLIYPGDTLRLVYIEGQPKILLQRGDNARVLPRVRSEPLEAAISTIPYDSIAAFMSKPSVLSKEQIKCAAYVLASLDDHEAIGSGNTIYARGFCEPAEVGSRYSIVRVGDELRDPDDNKLLGYNGIYTATGRVTRGGDPTTLIVTDSGREAEPGDKVLPGSVDVALDFAPSAPHVRVKGRLMAVTDGVTVIGQYQVVAINRGIRDGLVPGNILAIFSNGEIVPDEQKHGFLGGSYKIFQQKVKLPNERIGSYMVFKTFDRMSFGLVLEANNIIKLGDFVENP